jgi:hypothetical protein
VGLMRIYDFTGHPNRLDIFCYVMSLYHEIHLRWPAVLVS